MLPRWKAYWIMRGVESYLIRHSSDVSARTMTTAVVDRLEKEQSEPHRGTTITELEEIVDNTLGDAQ